MKINVRWTMDKKKEKLFSHSISSLFRNVLYNLKILKLLKYNNVEVYISNYNFSVVGVGDSIKVAKYKVTINLHNMIHECSLFKRGPT